MKQYLTTQLKEFNALEIGSKICLVGSWVAGCGAALLVGSSAVTLLSWGNDTEPSLVAKQSMFAGFGMLVSGVMFTTGAAMEDDRQSEVIAENFYTSMAERRAQKESSPCPNCNFFSGDCDLYCALHPTIAATPEAHNCKDFESKEIISHGS